MRLYQGKLNSNGFSLIELMVVVSIMGIIMTIGLGQYNRYKHKAYDVEAEGNIRSAIKILKALDTNEEYPSVNFEVSNSNILIDANNFAPQFPKITDNPKGVYLYILKSGYNVNIISMQCHGTLKYEYNATSSSEFIVTTAPITDTDLTTKCAGVI